MTTQQFSKFINWRIASLLSPEPSTSEPLVEPAEHDLDNPSYDSQTPAALDYKSTEFVDPADDSDDPDYHPDSPSHGRGEKRKRVNTGPGSPSDERRKRKRGDQDEIRSDHTEGDDLSTSSRDGDFGLHADQNGDSDGNQHLGNSEPEPHYDQIHPRQRKKQLEGTLLTSEVGTGKTLTYGTVLLMEYYRIRELQSRGKAFDAYPSIIVMPPSLVVQTFNELHNTFKELNFWVWYDSQWGISQEDPRWERTLTQQKSDEKMKTWIENRNSADTATIIIASHSTLTSRWAWKETVEFEPGSGVTNHTRTTITHQLDDREYAEAVNLSPAAAVTASANEEAKRNQGGGSAGKRLTTSRKVDTILQDSRKEEILQGALARMKQTRKKTTKIPPTRLGLEKKEGMSKKAQSSRRPKLLEETTWYQHSYFTEEGLLNTWYNYEEYQEYRLELLSE
ncbi:hypothetical protein QBC45DRAFT_389921 [Copromyces sp. CBS 386.78]|nr:hypothetical protein QBC45DRAFT_389921 [Copromyces sp. CBS 386.78]